MNRNEKHKLQKRYQIVIDKLKNEIKELKNDNLFLKEENSILNNQITKFDSLYNEYKDNIETVKKLKAEYQNIINEAYSVKTKYKKELNKLIKSIKNKV